jgi:hypothetical protein
MAALDQDDRSESCFMTREGSGRAQDSAPNHKDVRSRIKSRRCGLLESRQLNVGQLVRPKRARVQ